MINSPANRQPFSFIITGLMAIATAGILFVWLANPITSTDIWWHMSYGRYILETGNLIVDHSLFSWTEAIPDTIYNAWLTQILLYGTYETGGISALLILRYLVFIIVFLLAWRFAVQRQVSLHPLAWAVILLGFSFLAPKQAVKPELFSLLFMSISVWWFYRMRANGANTPWFHPYLFPIILVLWVNLHGGFFLVAPFFATVIVGELMNARFSPKEALPRKLRKHLFIAFFLCFPALLANPYGYLLPLDIIQNTLNQSVTGMNKISDYLPTYIFNAAPYHLLDYLIIAMLIFVFLQWQKLKERHPDWVSILSFLAYCLLFVQMIRVVHFLGPVFMFAGLDLLAKKEHSWAWPKHLKANILVTAFSVITLLFIGWRTWSAYDCIITAPAQRVSQMLDPSSNSVWTEADYIEKHLDGENIGNIYSDGGVLVFRFWPEKKVMIDPRAFPYDAWIDQYFRFTDGVGIADFVSRYPADYWLINYSKLSPFQWFIKSKDWHLAFLGPKGGVFVPNSSNNSATVISPKVENMYDQNAIATAFLNALLLDDLNFAEKLTNIANNNLSENCGIQGAFIKEMRDTLKGYKALSSKNYMEAAALFDQDNTHFKNKGRAYEIYMLLAAESLETGNYGAMRHWALKAYRTIGNNKTMNDLYNMALADWYYRQYATDHVDTNPPTDDLTWKRITAFILKHEDSIPEHLRFIAETAHAMNKGQYDSPGKFIPRKIIQ